VQWNDCVGDYAVVAYAKNSCGQSYIATKWVNVYNSSNNPCNRPSNGSKIDNEIKVFPNPIKNESFTINKEAPTDPCNRIAVNPDKLSKLENNVKIFDMYGNLVYQKYFYSDRMSILDLKLMTGNYV
jgi:hypothetical protein